MFLYARTCPGWVSEDKDHVIVKLGCTFNIEERKWQGSTERTHPSKYIYYIKIIDMGEFRQGSLKTIEATIFNYEYFARRRLNNGLGAGKEFFRFRHDENSLIKMKEVLLLHGVKFEVFTEDIFLHPPKKIREECIADEPGLSPKFTVSTVQTERKYQHEAVTAMKRVAKGIIIVATGGGKTVIYCLYIRDVPGVYLIVVPSLGLVNQIYNSCRQLCPDYTVYRFGQDRIDELGHRDIIIGTYQSSHHLIRIKGIDCIIFDECHSTVVLNPHTKDDKELSRFQRLLGYNCQRKFFFTATAKNITGQGEISMDNEDYYGPILYNYSLERGINEGYLCDYQFDLVATKNKTESVANYVRLRRKTVIFCSTLDKVKRVYNRLEKLLNNCEIYHLGDSDSRDDDRVLRRFGRTEKPAALVVCKKANLGYDEPAIDTVIHYDISTSSIMTLQRNGRAVRLHQDKIMAKMVFLCRIGESDEQTRDNIAKLHLSIQFMKKIDSRIADRMAACRSGEEGFVNIRIDGDDMKAEEAKRIYDRCWRLMTDNTIPFRQAKELIARSSIKPNSKLSYQLLREDIDLRLPENPPEAYINDFVDWVDYLGLNRANYVSLDEYKNRFNSLYKPGIVPTDICDKLGQQSRFPPTDMVLDVYKLNDLSTLIRRTRSISPRARKILEES